MARGRHRPRMAMASLSCWVMSRMPRALTNCLMCKTPLSHLQQVQNERFCGERCRGTYATLPPHQVCLACGRPLSAHEFGARACASPECLRQAEEQKRERERLRREALKGRAREYRDAQAIRLGHQEPETYWPTVIPSWQANVTDLAEDRRAAFRDTLTRLISAASAASPAPAPSEPALPEAPASPLAERPALQAVLNRACALCRGFCCQNGGNHAYLTVETLRRYMTQHPGQLPGDVLAAYLGRFATKTYEASCIFHEIGGCSLPPDMRSDTCNRFFCAGLTELQNDLNGRAPARAFFVAISGDEIRAAAFCDENGSRVVGRSPAEERPASAASTAGPGT